VLHRVSIHLTISSAVKAGTRSSDPPSPIPLIPKTSTSVGLSGGLRLNKFVRRLHDMLQAENGSGLVEWRKGLLVLYSTDDFAKKLLPKYFNTHNFKTFRRQVRMVVLMDKLCLSPIANIGLHCFVR
jgi:hypothetical protein